MPQMKPIFWLDVLTSNSLCLMSVMSMLYFLFLSPPLALDFNNSPISLYNQTTLNQWFWKW